MIDPRLEAVRILKNLEDESSSFDQRIDIVDRYLQLGPEIIFNDDEDEGVKTDTEEVPEKANPNEPTTIHFTSYNSSKVEEAARRMAEDVVRILKSHGKA